MINLARDSEFSADFQKQAPRPQSKKVGRVSNHDKAMSRLVKSPNQIVFNPATQVSVDHSDIPEGQTIPSGKKIIRKVKKGTNSGISKSDIALAMNAGAHVNLTGHATSSTKASHAKNNLTLQQPGSGFGG